MVTTICIVGTIATIAVPAHWSDRILERELSAVTNLRRVTEAFAEANAAQAERPFTALTDVLRYAEMPSDSAFEAAGGTVLRSHGYLFRLDPAAGETDAARGRWVAYAWPVAYGISGRAVYALDDRGRLFRTENAIEPFSGPASAPPADFLGRELEESVYGPSSAWVRRVRWQPVD